MSGRRPPSRLVAACALAFVSAPAIAAAQPAPPPGQYQPYSPPWPYSQPAPSPYARPLPYPQPVATPGYQPLANNAEDPVSRRRARSWPIFRVSTGGGATLLDGEVHPSFVLDVTAGYRWAFHRRAFLAFEGGYSLDSEPRTGGHFGALGLGPELFFGRYVGVGWMPKFVIGESWQGLAFGVRNTLTVPFLYRVFSVEIGHQYLRVDDRLDVHEVRAQLGVDLAAAAYVYVRRRVRGAR